MRIAATSVNLSDWECLRGSPAYARIGGLRFPASGRSARTSPAWSTMSGRGDPVPTRRRGVWRQPQAEGWLAEYTLAPESALAHKPGPLTFVEASTIPQAGAIALQGTERAVTGCRVLINGAGGGSGSLAIQLAKRLGAHVTGVDNASKLEFMQSVGADRVIDYRRDDFTRTSQRYDLILDLAAHRSVFAYRRVLAPGGTYRCRVGRCPRCWVCLPSADWLGGSPVAQSGSSRSRRGRPTLSRLPPFALPGTSGFTSIAPSRSTRFPPRLPRSVRAAHPAKWLSSSPDGWSDELG